VEVESEDIWHDLAPPNEQVPWWMWSSGLVVAIFLTCLVLGVQYGQNIGVSILSIVFGFILAFISAEHCGRTNITPVTSTGNASQLIIGGITKSHYPRNQSMMLNCTGGLIAAGASEQSVDMLGNLKTTHLIGASPRVQFYA